MPTVLFDPDAVDVAALCQDANLSQEQVKEALAVERRAKEAKGLKQIPHKIMPLCRTKAEAINRLRVDQSHIRVIDAAMWYSPTTA